MANSFLLGTTALSTLYKGTDLSGRYKGTSPEWSFDPLTLAPTWWLDASDEATFTLIDSTAQGGGPGRVKQWRDKSGNGNHASVSDLSNRASQRCVRETDHPAARGRPSVRALTSFSCMPSADLDLATPNAPEVNKQIRIAEYYIVVAAMTGVETLFNQTNLWNGTNGADGYSAMFGGGGDLGAPRMMGLINSAQFIQTSPQANLATGGYKNGSTVLIGDDPSRPVLPMPLCVMRFVATSPITAQRFLFNQNISSSRAWKGPICEVLAFGTVLSEADRLKVNAYLMKKWGIAA